MFTVAVGAAVQALLVALAVRGVGSCWIGSTIFAADLVRDELDLPADWEPLGAIAIGYPDEPSGPRDPRADRRPAGARVSLHDSAVDGAERAGAAPDPAQDTLRHAVLAFLAARPDACLRECVPGHVTALGARARPHRHPRAADAASAVRAAGCSSAGTARTTDADIVAAALREATEESGIDGLTIDPEPAALHVHPVTCSLGVPTRHLDMQFIVHAPGGAEIALQRRVSGPALVAAGRAAGCDSACELVRRASRPSPSVACVTRLGEARP